MSANRKKQFTSTALCTAIAAAAVGGYAWYHNQPSPSSAASASYDHSYQEKYGGNATFHVSGAVIGGDNQGDAILDSVEMPNGDEFTEFYLPVAVHDMDYTHDGTRMSARGGTNCTIGLNYEHKIGQAEGTTTNVSATDRTVFEGKLLEVMQTPNLNNYVDFSGDPGAWSFIIEFQHIIRDDDPNPDDSGELLYFERGSGSGNSWLTIQAVDENGNALGPPLAVSPDETLATSPPAIVALGQGIGAAAIDLSRLGVTSARFLKVSRPNSGEGGYTSGERAPDFKFMSVIVVPVFEALGD